MSELATEPALAGSQPLWKSRTILQYTQSEAAILLGMLLSLGIYYFLPGLPAALAGGILFFLLTLYRPALSLAMVPLAAPLFYHQREIDVRNSTLFFSLAEFIILTGVAAWIIRDGWTLLRTRALPWKLAIPRDWTLLFALGFGLLGLLWIFVPDIPTSDLRKIALRDFRINVAEPVIFFLLMYRWLRTERDVWRMVAAWLITAAFVGREAVEQYVLGQAPLMEGVGRATSVYPSATALGIYLGRALPLSVVLAVLLPIEWRVWRIAALLLSIPIGLGVLLSFARGAWIGVVLALVVVALVARQRWLLALLGAGVVAGLVALPFIKIERITSLFDFSTPDNTGVARAKIWTAALKIIADHPIKGIGQDQFLYQDPKYGVPQMRFFTTSHPHDFVLDFWLRLGLPGLAWIVAILAFFFWHTLRLWNTLKGTALGALVLGLLASMVDFVVHGLLDMAYFTMDLALTFWLTVGLVAVISRINREGEESLYS